MLWNQLNLFSFSFDLLKFSYLLSGWEEDIGELRTALIMITNPNIVMSRGYMLNYL